MKKRGKTDYRQAFTLLEMVIALVLASLLLVTLTGVLRRCFTEIRIGNDDSNLLKHGLLIEQLHRDMCNSRSMQLGNNRIRLSGFIHRDPETLIATQRVANVTYEVRQNGDQSLLVRIQSAGNLRSRFTTEQFVEPVFAGVASMVLSSNLVNAFGEADRIGIDVEESSRRARRQFEIPSSVRIGLLDQRGRTILDQTFLRQREE